MAPAALCSGQGGSRGTKMSKSPHSEKSGGFRYKDMLIYRKESQALASARVTVRVMSLVIGVLSEILTVRV